MTKPTHVKAFEFITEGTQNEMRDYIAFGLFMQSESKMVAEKGSIPTSTEYEKYHQYILNAYERERFRAGADQVLANFAATAINTELLTRHRKFRWGGVLEAILGAAAWTFILIAVTIAARRGGIDLLDYYRRAAGGGTSAP
jgi:hypothetical protein